MNNEERLAIIVTRLTRRTSFKALKEIVEGHALLFDDS